jgi:hypothetical protein
LGKRGNLIESIVGHSFLAGEVGSDSTMGRLSR